MNVRGHADDPRHVWLCTFVLVSLIIGLTRYFDLQAGFPEALTAPLAEWINIAANELIRGLRPLFRTISHLLSLPLNALIGLLQWLPWLAVLTAFATIALCVRGTGLAAFTVLSFGYIAVTGYWEEAMFTLASTIVVVPFSVALGILIGIAAYRHRLFRHIADPCLSVMQTVPPFAYLVPMIVLFGLGPAVGLVATIIYALPPMIRNAMLGLQRVPTELREVGMICGATRRQLLVRIELPVALPAILLGVNQTIMAALSMVVISSILGGLPDIGLEVYTTMKKAQFGQSILSGLVIALLAMVLDRISQAFARRAAHSRGSAMPRITALAGSVLCAVLVISAEYFPDMRTYPETLVFYPAGPINQVVDWAVATLYGVTSFIKTQTLVYLLIPLRSGILEGAVTEGQGLGLSFRAFAAGWLAIATICLIFWRRARWQYAVALAVLCLIYSFGIGGLPWATVLIVVAAMAYSVAGWRLAALVGCGLLAIGVSGSWSQAMISLQLCLAGIVIAFLLGASIGILAALNDTFSKLITPICDTLQTMPIFVFLIPAVMFFLVGEFTALVAIVLYAVVPSVRYTEHGLRNVPPHLVEAARAVGATRLQIVRSVMIPLAAPEILLGLNQTIMMGWAMVVVATLVGAKGLGQDVMLALTWADLGKGMIAGLSVAILAMISDRILREYSSSRRSALGLSAEQ
ncbi:MAG: ABC transporter permease [Parvibaculaceae bacterium]